MNDPMTSPVGPSQEKPKAPEAAGEATPLLSTVVISPPVVVSFICSEERLMKDEAW